MRPETMASHAVDAPAPPPATVAVLPPDAWLDGVDALYTPSLAAPHLVEGLLRFPDMADALEAAVRRVRRTYAAHGAVHGQAFDDDMFNVAFAEGKPAVYIKDLATCDPVRARVVAAYFPGAKTGAHVRDTSDARVPRMLDALCTFVPALWLAQRDGRGSYVAARYPPQPPATEVTWLPASALCGRAVAA